MSKAYSVSFVAPFVTTSEVLRPDEYHDAFTPRVVSSATIETYGQHGAPTIIRIGNGGLGPSGLVGKLALIFLHEREMDGRARFEWVSNHSRHSQIALQAGVIDVAMTYERAEEARAEAEGWWTSKGVFCHDHFVLVGPRSNPAGLSLGFTVEEALARIAATSSAFHTRGDGSATMHKEHELWDKANVPFEVRMDAPWYVRHSLAPRPALVHADNSGAYILTDRATFLPAIQQGEITNMAVYVEGGEEMMNSCALGIRSSEKRQTVLDFVDWLQDDSAQTLIASYGTDWNLSLPVVTAREQLAFQYGGEYDRVLPFDLCHAEECVSALGSDDEASRTGLLLEGGHRNSRADIRGAAAPLSTSGSEIQATSGWAHRYGHIVYPFFRSLKLSNVH